MPVADYLRLSRTTVWRWYQSGELKAFKDVRRAQSSRRAWMEDSAPRLRGE